MAVALHDLRGGRLEADPEPRAHRLLHRGRQVRERADGARDLADRGLLERAREPHALAAHLLGEHEQLEAERGGLGVHAVGAADARRVLELARAPHEHAAQALDARREEPPRVADLERERGVEHVARGDAVVHVARVGADRAPRASVSERDHVVAHALLDLGDARRIDRRLARGSPRAPRRGIKPRSACTSQTASSTSSQRAYFPSSEKISAISGRE